MRLTLLNFESFHAATPLPTLQRAAGSFLWCRMKWNLSTPSTSRKDTQNDWLQWDHHGLLETDPKTPYDHSLDSRLRKRHTGVWANDSDLTVTEPWNQMVSSGESNMMVFHPVIRRVPPKKVARIMASLPSSWWGWLVGTGQVDRIAVGQCQGGFMYRNIAVEICGNYGSYSHLQMIYRIIEYTHVLAFLWPWTISCFTGYPTCWFLCHSGDDLLMTSGARDRPSDRYGSHSDTVVFPRRRTWPPQYAVPEIQSWYNLRLGWWDNWNLLFPLYLRGITD